jgi:uncharacterized protein DUF3800
MIVVYADESGTHDPEGIQAGSQYPIIAGFAARKSAWDSLIVSWGAVLKTYDVPYFHGRELSAARVAAIQHKRATKELLKNPYYVGGWDVNKIDSFRKSLTKIAAAGNKIPIAGAANLPVFNRIKDSIPNKDPYKLCMVEFFKVFRRETALQWGNFKSDVSFVFDQNEKKEWVSAIHEVFGVFQKDDPRMSAPMFADKKKPQYYPLQAADLLAYRARQLLEDWANNRLVLDELDRILNKNLLKSARIMYPHLKRFLK